MPFQNTVANNEPEGPPNVSNGWMGRTWAFETDLGRTCQLSGGLGSQNLREKGLGEPPGGLAGNSAGRGTRIGEDDLRSSAHGS